MGVRQREWAARVRTQLIEQLGGECVLCGRTWGLEFDHINGRDWSLTAVSSDHRICIYRREAKMGLLQILCRPCNSSKGKP